MPGAPQADGRRPELPGLARWASAVPAGGSAIHSSLSAESPTAQSFPGAFVVTGFVMTHVEVRVQPECPP